MQIGKKYIVLIAPLYFLNFPSDVLAAAVPLCRLIKCKYLAAMVSGTVTFQARHFTDFYGINVQPSGRLPSTLEIPGGSLEAEIEALENKRQM